MAQRIGILVICDNKVGLEGQVVVRNFGGGGGWGLEMVGMEERRWDGGRDRGWKWREKKEKAT